MPDETEDRGWIRRYLLGRLQEGDLVQFEERIMADTDFFNQVLFAEDELIEEYVEGDLPESDRTDFESSFLSTPQGRTRVNYRTALYKRINAGPLVPDAELKDSDVPASPRLKREGRHTRSRKEKVFGGADVTGTKWWHSTPPLYFVAAALIAIAVAVALLWMQSSDVNKGMKALAYAYRGQRPLEARLTRFNYAPPPDKRGSEETVDSVARNQAERLLLDAVMEHPDYESHHALGKLYLAERKFDEAIKQFEEAIKAAPNNAALQSDYGAALLEAGKADQSRGEPGKSLEEFGQSDEQLSKALELDPTLLEALFNRALCREQMLLHRGAEEDWEDYLKKDKNSKWADEAREHLKEIQNRKRQTGVESEQLLREFIEAYRDNDGARAWKLVCENRDLTGSVIEDGLVDSYLNSTANGQSDDAKESLKALSYAGEVTQRHSGDLYISGLVRFYESTTPPQRKEILRARSLIKSGRDSVSKSNFNVAINSYEDARQMLRRLRDYAEVIKMDFIIGNCYLQQSKAGTALSYFQRLLPTCHGLNFRFLELQLFYATSGAHQYVRDFSAAIYNTNRAIKLSAEMGDAVAVLKARYQMGEINRFVNNESKALDLYFQDLPIALSYPPPSAQLWARYFSISRALDQLGGRSSAIGFQKEALSLAQEARAERSICRSYNYLGFIFAKHGDYVDATDCITRAVEVGSTFLDQKVRMEALAYSYLQLGYVYRKTQNFDNAIENYDQAIRFYDDLDAQFFAYTARKEKLLCCIEQEACTDVENQMETVLNLFEAHRSKILEESNRNTFFDSEQTIYDVAIEFEFLKKGDYEKAFEYAEKSRGRSLSDMAHTGVNLVDNPDAPEVEFGEVSQPMNLEKIREQMPEQSQIIQYAVLKNNIIIWVVSKQGISAEKVDISTEELNTRVSAFRRLLANGVQPDSEEFCRMSIFLHDVLIKPVSDLLDPNKQLCIVPDKVLNYLPFAALKSKKSNKYFTDEQERGFVLSPSSNMFVINSVAARKKQSRKSEQLLSVGDPRFDGRDYPDLGRLQSARSEVESIAPYYGSRRPLTGAAATRKQVMSEMEESDVIHLAAHAITDQSSPLRSKLLLAKEPSQRDEGVLRAYDIYKLNLTKAKLVVLSACQTAVERDYRGEGMIGLSRPFMAKGVPLVVASLWPVDSGGTSRLMISFHRHRKMDPLPTAEALRKAQLEMLGSSNEADRSPRNWAAFVAIGAYASF